ncbi:MAG: CoA transferase [Actinobacteria bacterium]|nr:CoA transferase [Actinomycetota bacterium]
MRRTRRASALEADALPLEGIRVLDLGRALSGPFCATLLGDLGADVVKVEQLPHGDVMRTWGPFHDGESVYFLSVNRNKRSVALDLRHLEGKRALIDLVAASDVLVENFRPGVMDALGLADETLERDHPAVIHCAVSAFGPRGPYAGLPGFDQVAQAMGGLMSVTGLRGGEPTRSGVAIADMLAGVFAALGAVAALVSRADKAAPRRVGSSLLEGTLGVLTFQAQKYLSLSQVAGPQGNDHPIISPYGSFQAADGPLVVACATEAMWRKLCEEVGLEDLVDDPRFETNAERVANRSRLTSLLNARLSGATKKEWFERLTQAGISAGPVNDVGEVFADPHVDALRSVREVDHAALGALRVVGPPFEIDGRPVPVRAAPPLLGEHTEAALAEAGMDEAEVRSLIDEGVAAQRPVNRGGRRSE